MKVVIADGGEDAARRVCDAVVDLLRAERDVVLGLAGGRTFEPVYRFLIERRPPVHDLTAVLLDEYLGHGPGDGHGFRRQVRVQLTDGLGLNPSRLRSLDGATLDVEAECSRFEEMIVELGGVDLQLLGLGANGHIAFNEPGSTRDSRTRLVQLTEETRAANASAFGRLDLVPRQALTQGIATILEARRIILMATGSHKAAAVAEAVDGPVDDRVPASALQGHPNTTVVLDPQAAQLLAACR